MDPVTVILIVLGIVIGFPLLLIVGGFWLFVGLAATTKPQPSLRADHSILHEATKETP